MEYPGDFVGPRDDPNRYRLLTRIGRGAEGEVWRATRELADGSINVAVKHYSEERFGKSESLDRLSARLEAQAVRLRRLHANGIARVQETFVGSNPHSIDELNSRQNSAYFVMEFIAGPPLLEWAQEESSLSRRLGVLTDVAGALDALHSDGQVHGDIKPSNLLIRTTELDAGDKLHVAVLVDFGVMRAISTEPVSTVIGTPGFLAPELENGGTYSPATDLYAFAMVCAGLVCKEQPGPGLTVEQAVRASGLPDEGVSALLAGLDPDPERRKSQLQNGVGGWLSNLSSGLATISFPLPASEANAQDGTPMMDKTTPLVATEPLVDTEPLTDTAPPADAGPLTETARLAPPTPLVESPPAEPATPPAGPTPAKAVTPAEPSSHPKKSRRRRLVLSAAVLLLVLAAGGAGIRNLLQGDDESTVDPIAPGSTLGPPPPVEPPLTGCEELVAYAAIDKSTVMEELATAFNDSELAGESGSCVDVTVAAHASGVVACWYLAQSGRDNAANGVRGCDPSSTASMDMANDIARYERGRPDLYFPANSVFGRQVEEDAPGTLIELAPSIASTEIVMAVREPVREVIEDCGAPLETVARLVSALTDSCVTEGLGRPLRIGKTNPFVSASGFGSTAMIASHSLGGEITVAALNSDENAAALRRQVEGAVAHYGSSGPVFLKEMSGESAYIDVALLEHKGVLDYNDGDSESILKRNERGSVIRTDGLTTPSDSLVPIIPGDGVVLSDNPAFAATDLSGTLETGAAAFVDFVRNDQWAQQRLGFYNFNEPADMITEDAQGAPLIPKLDAETADRLISLWADAERKPVRALFAVDVSGSMTGACGGEDRLGAVQAAIDQSLEQFSSNDLLAIVPFSSDNAGDMRFPTDAATYLAPTDQATSAAADGLADERGAFIHTPLFDAAIEGVRSVAAQAETDDGAFIEVVVLLTDGVDDPTGSGGCDPSVPTVPADVLESLSQATEAGNVRLFAIAFGGGADLEGVTQMANATGGFADKAGIDASLADGDEATGNGDASLIDVYRRIIAQF